MPLSFFDRGVENLSHSCRNNRNSSYLLDVRRLLKPGAFLDRRLQRAASSASIPQPAVPGMAGVEPCGLEIALTFSGP